MNNILVTGGLGYIGSFTALRLMASGFSCVIIDNLSNGKVSTLDRLEKLAGVRPAFYENDFADTQALKNIIEQESISAAIHFAAFKYVNDSVTNSLPYFRNNVAGFIDFADLMREKGLPLIFSSSAAVYGSPDPPRSTEQTPCNPDSPYGWSKRMDEVILQAAAAGEQPLSSIVLRYFNVVGAHPSGVLGEDARQTSPMLIPSIIRSVLEESSPLIINGTDYPTPDGTCLRDYVHVLDVADAHVAALNHILKQSRDYFEVFNVGTGRPNSVLEVINAFERVNKLKVPHEKGSRRAGDAVAYFAATDKIKEQLNWTSKLTVEDACHDEWKWAQNKNV